MIDKTALLEAHVQFELDRWGPDALERSVADEVAGLARWVGSRRLDEIVTPAQVTDWISRYASELPLSEQLIATVAEIVRAGHVALAHEGSRVRDMLPRANYEQFIAAVLGMADIRQTVPARVTRSAIYAQLVNHLLHQGIKAFLLKENVLARRLPGASSLLRFGQNAISTNAPNLERSMDRQLASFIKANIAETIRDSEHYLRELLDDPHLRAAAEELWTNNASESVGELARLLDSASLDRLVTAGRDMWLHLRKTPMFARLSELLVAEFFRLHGEQPVSAVLADLGIELVMVQREVTTLVIPVLTQARDDGFLEGRIRSRLDGFYSAYFTGPPDAQATKPAMPAKAKPVSASAPATAPRKRAPARRNAPST